MCLFVTELEEINNGDIHVSNLEGIEVGATVMIKETYLGLEEDNEADMLGVSKGDAVIVVEKTSDKYWKVKSSGNTDHVGLIPTSIIKA